MQSFRWGQQRLCLPSLSLAFVKRVLVYAEQKRPWQFFCQED